MKWSSRLADFAVISALLVSSCVAAHAQPQSPPSNGDVAVYEQFRAWLGKLPPEQQAAQDDEVFTAYRKVLTSNGMGPAEIERQIRIINDQGRRLEIERWNRILTASTAPFNRQPNAFLMEMTKGRTAGTALDVGMGQGRNAIYLAQQGWRVTGFDPAERAVAAAREQAKRLGVTLTALPVGDDQFDFGRDRWDLIVLSYVGAREFVGRVFDSLRPGGVVVVEAFHRDATRSGPIGGAVVFDTNELLKIFDKFRVIRYEDTEAVGDFGLQKTRVVRLAAEKPEP